MHHRRAGVLLVCLATPNDAALLQNIETLTLSAPCPALVIDPQALLRPEQLKRDVRHLTGTEAAPCSVLQHLALVRLKKRGPKTRLRSEPIHSVTSVA